MPAFCRQFRRRRVQLQPIRAAQQDEISLKPTFVAGMRVRLIARRFEANV
jgi:hypothetical protein